MSFVPAICPQCGGNIEVDSNKEKTYCQHCGTPFYLKDVNNITNYNISMNLSEYKTVKLVGEEQKNIAKLMRMVSNISKKYPPLLKEIKEKEIQLKKYQSKRTYKAAPTGGEVFLGVFLMLLILIPDTIFVIIALFGMLAGWADGKVYAWAIITLVVSLIVFVVTIVVGVKLIKIVVKREKEKYEEEIKANEDKIKREYIPAIQARLSELYSAKQKMDADPCWDVLKYVPELYQYDFALNKLAEYLETGRAEDMKEAMNLFEEEKHRWRIEEIQKQQASQLASIRSASTISAAANLTSAINSFR